MQTYHPKIAPKLADKGIYIASESSFNRALKAENQLKHRQKSKPVRQVKKPKALTGTAPNQIYSWDITCLPTHGFLIKNWHDICSDYKLNKTRQHRIY